MADQGFATRLGIDTVPSVTKQFDFESENFRRTKEPKILDGLSGSRSRFKNRMVSNNMRRVSGPITMQPTAAEFALLFPWWFGGVPIGSGTTVYPLADAISDRYVLIDRVSKRWLANGVKASRITFAAQQGDALTVTPELVGKDMEPIDTAFPALALDDGRPFMFRDCSLVIDPAGTAENTILTRDISLVVDNVIDMERFFNSPTLTEVNPQDRLVTFTATIPASDAEELHEVERFAVEVAFANDEAILTFLMEELVLTPESPVVEGRKEIMVKITGQAGATMGTQIDQELITSIQLL